MTQFNCKLLKEAATGTSSKQPNAMAPVPLPVLTEHLSGSVVVGKVSRENSKIGIVEITVSKIKKKPPTAGGVI